MEWLIVLTPILAATITVGLVFAIIACIDAEARRHKDWNL
jgi:hypothetical protein